MIPGWPYSIVAALETGRTSWTALLDAIRLEPGADVAATSAAQLREVVTHLIDAGQHQQDDPPILIVVDAGYDVPRMAFLLQDIALSATCCARLLRPDRHGHPASGAGLWAMKLTPWWTLTVIFS